MQSKLQESWSLLVRNKKINFLKEKIKKTESVIGTWNTILDPSIIEVLASSGLDFIIIDFEHGPFRIDKVSDFVNASEIYNCSPIVRIPKNNSWMSLQALDQGAHGIMLPGVKTVEDTKSFIDQLKYSPEGKRGFSPFTKSGSFSNSDRNYKIFANDFNLSSIIIEDQEGLNNIEEILEVDFLDIIYFGAYDLSQNLGFTGDVFNKQLIEKVSPAIEKVLKSGKYAGGFVPKTIEEIKFVKGIGINFITFDVDTSLIKKSYNDICNWFNLN